MAHQRRLLDLEQYNKWYVSTWEIQWCNCNQKGAAYICHKDRLRKTIFGTDKLKLSEKMRSMRVFELEFNRCKRKRKLSE